MVLYCCAYGCSEKFVKGGSVTFHNFPKAPDRRKLWEVQLRRKDFKATDHSKLCSKHFTPDSFDTRKFGGTWLKSTAVPSVFNFPSHLQKAGPSRKAPTNRGKVSIDDISDDEQNGSDPTLKKTKRLHYMGDFKESDLSSPTKAKKFLQVSQDQVSSLKVTVRQLSRKTKRLEKQISSLSDTVDKLLKEN